MNTITQDMRFRLSLIRYANKHRVSKVARQPPVYLSLA